MFNILSRTVHSEEEAECGAPGTDPRQAAHNWPADAKEERLASIQ
jgi:hypothetical protein